MDGVTSPSTPPLLQVTGLHVASAEGGDEILRGVDLTVGAGEVHALMGPNGSGKSTLANALLGSPEYTVTAGTVHYRGDDVTDWGPDEPVDVKFGVACSLIVDQEMDGVARRRHDRLRQPFGQERRRVVILADEIREQITQRRQDTAV